MLTIDRLKRTITIPNEDKIFGVESDDDYHTIYFSCPADLDPYFNLQNANLYINYQTPNGEKDQYIVTDKKVSLGECSFSWVIPRKALQYKGNLKFIFCAKIMDGETVAREWNTTTATGTILEGLEPEGIIVEEDVKDNSYIEVFDDRNEYEFEYGLTYKYKNILYLCEECSADDPTESYGEHFKSRFTPNYLIGRKFKVVDE